MNSAARTVVVLSSPIAGGGGGRPRQPKRCLKLNGEFTYINLGGGLIASGDFTVSVHLKSPDLFNSRVIFGMGDPQIVAGTGVVSFIDTSGNLRLITRTGADSRTAYLTGFTANAWHHLAFVVSRTAGKSRINLNGANSPEVDITHLSGSLANGSLFIGKYGTQALYPLMWFFDFQLIPKALTDLEITALRTSGASALPGQPRTAWYKLDEQHPTKTYDSSGNSHDGTLVNIPVPPDVLFYEGEDIPFSYQNEVGYTLDGSVYVPRDESAITKDVLGGPLQFAGHV